MFLRSLGETPGKNTPAQYHVTIIMTISHNDTRNLTVAVRQPIHATKNIPKHTSMTLQYSWFLAVDCALQCNSSIVTINTVFVLHSAHDC